MDDWLTQLRAAEQHAAEQIHQLLRHPASPHDEILEAFKSYRSLCQAIAFADFRNAAHYDTRMWQFHTDAKKFFHRALSNMHRNHPNQLVETRELKKTFLRWIKQSQRFYREHIFRISAAAGGIPELEAIAQRDKGEGVGESQEQTLGPEYGDAVLDSCHQIVCYLGDLSRYRASENLDQEPDLGPAIGYYGLAATLKPSSGMGHHQQAVVALDQARHLTAIYHLYRAIAVREPHPNAKPNLQREFAKTLVAWDKGELIQKGPPNDPDASKHHLVGWFVRMHSMCFHGDRFQTHEQLELEVLSQLSNVIKTRSLDGVLMRMVLVNIAAQDTAGERFQSEHTLGNDDQSEKSQQSFLYYLRFNLKTFTALLRIFYDDLRALLLSMDDHDVELAAKLTVLGRRVLPCLRIYNKWLLTQIPMIQGLARDEFLTSTISEFWVSYARAVDLIAQAFPIWDLEDVPQAEYMLEEDVETLEFKPLLEQQKSQVLKTWYFKSDGSQRPRFSDRTTVRIAPDEESLHRVNDFLADGLYLANDVDDAPLLIRGTRIFHGDESRIEALVIPEKQYEPEHIAPPEKAAEEKMKPVSYATAAANGHARSSRPAPAASKPSVKQAHSRDAQLSRMVDDLVDDDDGNHPATPPQQIVSHPAIVTNGEVPYALKDSVHELPGQPKQPHLPRPSAQAFVPRPNVTLTPPPAQRTAAHIPIGAERGQRDRMQSVSRLWDNAPGSISPSFPSGLPPLGSPVTAHGFGHSRVNSASSIRSRNSLTVIDSWGTTESATPRTLPDTIIGNTIYGTPSQPTVDQSGMVSPFLFGGGGGLWSTGAPPHATGNRNNSPPNGHGSTNPNGRGESPPNARGGRPPKGQGRSNPHGRGG